MEAPRIFESAAIIAAVALAKKVGPVDIPVLISGETGTGKEIIAEIIHNSSLRRTKEMISINCAGLPGELIENELFGSRRGAFTGSVDEKSGLVRQADNSTLFLDELSDMPFHLQSKLLRFIQDKNIRRLGSVVTERINTRIIAAVNKTPSLCVAEKCLREDLYYRLSAVTIIVPPLRERVADIMPLAKAYLHHFSAQFNRTPPLFTSEAAKALTEYSWPGNVRQLINEMTRCALLCGKMVHIRDLNLPVVTTAAPVIAQDSLQQWLSKDISTLTVKQQRDARSLIDALNASEFIQEEAAERLGVSRGTVYTKMKTYGIKKPTGCERDGRRIRRHNGHVDHLNAPSSL